MSQRGEEIYQEIKKRMAEQNLHSRPEYLELIDQVIREYVAEGVLSPEEDTKSLREELEVKWGEKY